MVVFMTTYTEKAEGSLMTAALGDGLGAFAECLHYKAVDKRLRSLPPIGHRGTVEYTDDTSLRLVIYETMLEAQIDANELAKSWKERVVDGQIYWMSELYVSAMISMGRDPHQIGYTNLVADNAAMAADPFGVFYPCHGELAALRAYETLSLCQSGAGLEGAMAVAAAVSASMSPEPNMDDTLEAAESQVGREMKKRIERAVTIVGHKGDPRHRLYGEIAVEDGTAEMVWSDINSMHPSDMNRRLVDLKLRREEISMGVSPLEVVPVALGYAVRGNRQPLDALKSAASFGRDSDTIAGIAGSILGAFHGKKMLESARNILPNGLVEKSKEISMRLQKLACNNVLKMSSAADTAKKLFAD
jgi:ADP-ribosylglycohydrolase